MAPLRFRTCYRILWCSKWCRIWWLACNPRTTLDLSVAPDEVGKDVDLYRRRKDRLIPSRLQTHRWCSRWFRAILCCRFRWGRHRIRKLIVMIFQDGIRCHFQVSQLNILAVSPWFCESRKNRFALVTVVLQHFLSMPELANRFSQVWKDSSFFPGMTPVLWSSPIFCAWNGPCPASKCRSAIPCLPRRGV